VIPLFRTNERNDGYRFYGRGRPQVLYWTVVALFLAALLLLVAVALPRQGAALAQPVLSPDPGPSAERGAPATTGAVEIPLSRIRCGPGYTTTVYAQGLSSPDGLALSPTGVLYVAEETAGRVSQIGFTGEFTPVITGLVNPEGITIDDSGNLYVVEDTQAGRLVKRTPDGMTTTLATGLEAPEGVAWASDDTLYVTESNIQFVTDPTDLRTRIAAVSSSGAVTRVITNTPTVNGTDVTFWSYAGLTIRADGLLYVTNEISGREITQTVVVIPGVLTSTFTLSTTDSIFTVDPAAGDRALFASNLVSPEGLRFSAAGEFPLYVAEEDVGGGAGRLSQVEPDGSHAPLCTGFFNIEDVAVDQNGWLYVSEDTSGLVILIKPTARYSLTVTPASESRSGSPGAAVTYTLQVTNTGNTSDTFDVSAGGYSWTTTAEPSTVGPLVADASADVGVTVTIPVSAADGSTDVTTIVVTSQGDRTVTATSTLATTARGCRIYLPFLLHTTVDGGAGFSYNGDSLDSEEDASRPGRAGEPGQLEVEPYAIHARLSRRSTAPL
jgi:sugar lactone lactonase YvrE